MKKYSLHIFLLISSSLLLCVIVLLHNRTEEKATARQVQTEANEMMLQRAETEASETEMQIETEQIEMMTEQIETEAPETEMQAETEQTVCADIEKQPIAVEEIETQRLSPEKIQISWKSTVDAAVDKYIVKKRPVFNNEPAGDWETVAVAESGLEEYAIEDTLTSSAPVQYEYRVDVEVTDDSIYEPTEGKSVLGSNVMICIDPGHYAGKNSFSDGDSCEYAEGDFTLILAMQLRDILKETYGIDSYMTRESGTISLGGYTNLTLDREHIALRGEYAAEQQSNLFVSIHTNANNNNANGYETWEQPIAINKALVFVNLTGKESETTLQICNAVGVNLSKVNYELGLSTIEDFRTINDVSDILEWTSAYNDGLNEVGTVVCRMNGNADYYGVLRGAASVGIPGIIVEHGMHTIPEVREAAQNGLAEYWAKADAYGIAYGFGFVENPVME